MPTYHEVMTTDLSTLTTAAEKWESMAGEFKKLEDQYKKDVHGISMGRSWTGLSAQAANGRFDVTLKEYQAAQKEAKAIASLLRDAHTQFVEARGKVKAQRDAAVDDGMRVSAQGVVQFDTSRLGKGEYTAYIHDRDYQESARQKAAEWAQRIEHAVKAAGDSDDGVKIALDAVVVDSDPLDGTTGGFNASAQGDIEKYEAQHLKDIATRINSGDASPADLREAQRSFRDNSADKVFGRTLLNGLGAEGTLTFTNKLSDLAHSGDKGRGQAYLDLQKGLATTLATATKDPESAFYREFREDLKKAGVKQYDLEVTGSKVDIGRGHGQQARGYQSLVTLMRQGDGYSGQFLKDMADDIRTAEDAKRGGDPDIWDLSGDFSGKEDGWFANDPLDGVLGIMADDPRTATGYLDPGPDGTNDNLKYLLDGRDWNGVDTERTSGKVEVVGPDAADKDNRAGFGAALESAATGHVPGSKHDLGGHDTAQARVMNETIGVLNAAGEADKLPANLRTPMSHMLMDYTPDTHQILGMDNNKYNGVDRVWNDDGQVRMAVPKEELVRIMRGVADDPEAFGQVYRAEKQYSQDVFAAMPDDAKSLATQNRIMETSAALGAYDGVRADVVFDKRFDNIQWANDFNHALTGSSGAVLNFTPEKMAVPGDLANRVLDFYSYEATKDRIAEASTEATNDNSKQFNAGQREVDAMVVEWAKSNGHKEDSDFTRNLMGHGQVHHERGRDGALRHLRADF